jgi:hypothetical protein
MRRADDENTEWTEYLLHNARAGFLWLVETDEGWFRAKVLDDWPQWERGDTAKLGSQVFRKKYEYPSRVLFAAGAFNWRVHAGDETRLIEFDCGQNSLAAEMTNEELTWSLSSPVAADQIRAWFGKEIKADKVVLKEKSELSAMALRFIYGMLIFNAIPLFMAFGRTWLYTALAAAALYLPAKYLDSMDE